MQTREIQFLILDQDATCRAQLERLISDARLGQSRSSSSLKEALDVLENHPIDVVISSWDLSGKANGLSFLKLIRGEDRFKHLGFVLLSSPSDDESIKVRSARAAHVDGYLLKPVDEAAMKNLLEDVVSKIPDLT